MFNRSLLSLSLETYIVVKVSYLLLLHVSIVVDSDCIIVRTAMEGKPGWMKQSAGKEPVRPGGSI